MISFILYQFFRIINCEASWKEGDFSRYIAVKMNWYFNLLYILKNKELWPSFVDRHAHKKCESKKNSQYQSHWHSYKNTCGINQ